MHIWFKMDLTQSHLRTSFQISSIVFPFFNTAETSSFAHPAHMSNAKSEVIFQKMENIVKRL
jgi:hypothetical protein